MNEQMLYDRMCQIMRVGFVNARQPEKMRVKVTINDTPGKPLITDWLPVLCPRACGDMQYDLPDIGDQVLCLFLPYGLEQGFVLGAMYGRQTPPVQSGDKWHRTFSDGAKLEYDRSSHSLTAEIPGTASIKASQSITLEAPIIYLRGTLVQSAKDGSPGISNFSGGINIQSGGVNVACGDVVASGVSLISHTTEGVEPGSGISSHPTGGADSSPGSAPFPFPIFGSTFSNLLILLTLPFLYSLLPLIPEWRRNRSKLLLCLPEIAEAMAKRFPVNSADYMGWNYLAQFLKYWFSRAAYKIPDDPSPEEKEKIRNIPPIFIEWSWLNSYPRIQESLDEFNDEKIMITDNFKKQFTDRLKEDGYFGDDIRYFNYIPEDLENEKDWKEWDKAYAQRVTVPGGIKEFVVYGADGLIAAMGNFTLRAIPKGYTKPRKEGGYDVVITEIAVYAYDTFNFNGYAPLGFWDCTNKKFSTINFITGTAIFNNDFCLFRDDTGFGGDFPIYSKPRIIDTFTGASYVAEL